MCFKTRIAAVIAFSVFAATAPAACDADADLPGAPELGVEETTSFESPDGEDFDAELGQDLGEDPDGPGWEDLDFKSRPAICGDGKVELPETCDDGNGNGEGTDCTPLCRAAFCGDGFVHSTDE